MKAFADTHPKLSGEDQKLFNETLRDYRRAGLALPAEKQKEVEQLRKELSKLGTDFDSNIVNAKAPVVFTKAELEGVPESFLSAPGVKTGDDAYTVLANVTWHFITVEENAKSEATRKKLYVIHDSLAKDTNVTVLNQMLALRNKIAPATRLQIVGRFPNGNQNGEIGRGREIVHRQADHRHSAKVRCRSFRDAKNESGGNERSQREDRCVGLALLHQPAEQTEIRGR